MTGRTNLVATGGALALCLAAVPFAPAAAAAHEDAENVAFTAGNGLSSEYHVYAEGVPRPAGLLVWTHGDGAFEFENPDSDYVMGGPEGVRELAQAEGYIVVSALSPDRDGTVTWWEDGEDNADYFADLLTHLTDEYDVDTSDVVLAGFSGGAQFTTMYFLPAHSQMLTGGGSIVFGGGGPPYEDPAWNEALKSDFAMHWATGALDDLEHSDEGYDALCYAREGVAYYSAAGFDTSYEWIPGRDHVIDGLFGGIVAQQLRSWPDRVPGEGPGTAPDPGSTRTPGEVRPGEVADWPVSLEFGSVGYAFLTVDVPADSTGYTTVRVDGADGTYWYQMKRLQDGSEFRMGDPCDYLSPQTEYTYLVTNNGQTYATGTFTTPDFTGPVDPVDPEEPGEPTDPVAEAPVVTDPPTISGTARVGRTLRATTGVWDAGKGDAGTVTYAHQWLRDGEPVPGAISERYRVTAADRGTRLSVEVTATRSTSSGTASATAASAEVVVTVPAVVSGHAEPFIARRGATVRAHVTVNPIGASVDPTGSVAVDVAGAQYMGTLEGGRAKIEITGLPRGLHVLTASYAGDGTVLPARGWGGVVLVL